jgi:hypothetical protein
VVNKPLCILMAVPFWRVSFWDMCFHFSQLTDIFSLSVMKLNGKQYKSHREVLDCKAGMPTEMVLNITNTSGERVCGMYCVNDTSRGIAKVNIIHVKPQSAKLPIAI